MSNTQSQSVVGGPSWIFPEMVSFTVRCSEIMAITIILEMSVFGAFEKLLLLLCGVIFFLNCFEFSRPPKEVIFLYVLSAILSSICVILLVLEASVVRQYVPEKYYTMVFESISAGGSSVVAAYFYFFQLRGK